MGAGRVIRNNIVVGLVLVTPIVVTALIIRFLVRFLAKNSLTRMITNLLFHLLPESVRGGSVRFMLGQFISVLLVLLLLFLLGYFVRSFIGRRLYRLAERILVRIPVFNKIYIHVRHISETIFAQRESMFQEVVLIEYPRKGLFSLGFITSEVPEKFARLTKPINDEGRVSAVFIPTTPNPTSGVMLLVPRAELTPLSLSIPDAMKLIISGGSVYPGDDDVDNRPTLLDKLEAWVAKDRKHEADHPPESPPAS